LTIGQAEGLGFFDGGLDEIRLYGNALSPSEVMALATVAEPGTLALLGGAMMVLATARKRMRGGARESGRIGEARATPA
jgi:hypothetical protein